MSGAVINWQRLLVDLRERGVSYGDIAKATGADEAKLLDLARGEGREPEFSVGLRLLDLHHDHCRKLHTRARLWIEEGD